MSTPRQRYARVPTEDAATTRAAAKKRRSELAEQVATKIQAAAWVAAGGFVAYQTDLPVVLLAGTETNRFWCDVAAACFAANCVLCFYLTVWLPHVQRCVEIKILRRVRAESQRRPPRHRRDACSMAWRCRFLAARRNQRGHAIAET